MGTQSVVQSVSAADLFDFLSSSFHIVWETCQNSRNRNITSDAIQSEHSDLAGFLNLIHMHKVQLIGPEEIRWLDALDARSRWEALIQLQNLDVMALIVCDAQTLPGDLVESTTRCSGKGDVQYHHPPLELGRFGEFSWSAEGQNWCFWPGCR